MPQPFLAVTLAAWSGGLSVMPHLGLYLEETPNIHYDGGEWAADRRWCLDLVKKRNQEYSSGVATGLFLPLTPEILHYIL